VDIGASEPRVMEPDSCDEWRWFLLDALPEKLFPPHALILRTVRGGQSYLGPGPLGLGGWSS
jgi:hypothetical protein